MEVTSVLQKTRTGIICSQMSMRLAHAIHVLKGVSGSTELTPTYVHVTLMNMDFLIQVFLWKLVRARTQNRIPLQSDQRQNQCST